jgi:acyl carrier protein
MENKVKEIMAEVLICNVEDINIDTKKDDLDNWDSLQHLIFVSQLESELGFKFTPEEINEMNGFAEIIKIINLKSNS